MWVGNPTQPKIYRSPWMRESIYPFGTDITNVQGKPPHSRLDQFGNVITSYNKELSVPGPIIRDQPLNCNPPEFPGEKNPTEVQFNADGTLQGKHFSSSIFYNQEYDAFIETGYGSAPFWRFGQWAYIYPEYLKLTCPVAEVGSVKIGEDSFGYDVTLSITVSSVNTGTFLLKRSSGYSWTADSGPNKFEQQATNLNKAWSISYVPCYSHTAKGFPSRFCNWSLSFRPFHYMNGSEDAPGNINGDTTSPFTWQLSCFEQTSLSFAYYITLTPKPSATGNVRFLYGVTLSSNVIWTDTGVLADDAELFRSRLQSALDALIPYDSEATIENASDASITYRVVLDDVVFKALSLASQTIDSVVTIEEVVDSGYRQTSGRFLYFIPSSGFSSPSGSCKDTRDIGIFDRPYMTTLIEDSGSNYLVFGEQNSRLGLSHGNMSFKKATNFRIHTMIPTSNIYSDPSFYQYPGWSLPSLARDYDLAQQLVYPITSRNALFKLSVEPIYL